MPTSEEYIVLAPTHISPNEKNKDNASSAAEIYLGVGSFGEVIWSTRNLYPQPARLYFRREDPPMRRG